jgi:hypothetical protein
MLTAACAAGIVLSLGTPIGGVLFSIEALSSIYIMSNIWKSFFCAVICMIISKLFNSSNFFNNVITNTNPIEFGPEIVLFILQGIGGGVIGFFITNFIGRIVYLRRKSDIGILKYRFRYMLLVGITVVLISYFVTPLRLTDKKMITHLFQHSKVEDDKDESITLVDGLSLLTVWILKSLMFILCMTSNIPCDIFTTVFSIGAIYGRLYGYYMSTVFGTSDITVYAMIGASCVFSGTTQTISSAIMIFEITGQSSYLPALLLATIIANLTSQSLSMSVYDMLLDIKNLPHLPSIKSHYLKNRSASDIMSNISHRLYIDQLSVINSMEVLSSLPRRYEYTIPILDENGIMRYTISTISLYKHLQSNYEKIRMNYNIIVQKSFSDYFNSLKLKFSEQKRSISSQIKHKFKKLYTNIRDRERIRLNRTTEEEKNLHLLFQFKESKYCILKT